MSPSYFEEPEEQPQSYSHFIQRVANLNNYNSHRPCCLPSACWELSSPFLARAYTFTNHTPPKKKKEKKKKKKNPLNPQGPRSPFSLHLQQQLLETRRLSAHRLCIVQLRHQQLRVGHGPATDLGVLSNPDVGEPSPGTEL